MFNVSHIGCHLTHVTCHLALTPTATATYPTPSLCPAQCWFAKTKGKNLKKKTQPIDCIGVGADSERKHYNKSDYFYKRWKP